jgi:hypothetical protein
MTSAAAAILMVKLPVALASWESKTLTWNVKEPAALGVPEMVPEDPRVTPPGRLPLVNCQVYGWDPPVAARFCE